MLYNIYFEGDGDFKEGLVYYIDNNFNQLTTDNSPIYRTPCILIQDNLFEVFSILLNFKNKYKNSEYINIKRRINKFKIIVCI